MGGTSDRIKGTVKDAAGAATGDKRLQAEGKADKAKGHAKEAASDVKETAKGVGDSLKRK